MVLTVCRLEIHELGIEKWDVLSRSTIIEWPWRMLFPFLFWELK